MQDPILSRFEFITHHSSEGEYSLACHHWPYRGKGKAEFLPLVAVHGLTRNGHDFDTLAMRLSEYCDVYCPDMPGRGDSDHIVMQDYNFEHYVSVIERICSHYNLEKMNWLGTSMGGILGMVIAGGINKNLIHQLILNDVGSIIPAQALKDIAKFVGLAPKFSDFDEAEKYVRHICKQYAPMSDKDFVNLTKTSTYQGDDGFFHMNYDPKIGDKFRADGVEEDIDLRPFWNEIRCDCFLIRGGKSKLFPSHVHDDMLVSNQDIKVESYVVETAGHVPSLNGSDDFKAIYNWLKKPLKI